METATTQRTPEEMNAMVDAARATVEAETPKQPEPPAKAQPLYERRGKVKFNSPREAQKTGKVFEGDLDFTKMNAAQLRAFRKAVKRQAETYANEYARGERQKDIAQFKQMRALMEHTINKANKNRLRNIGLAIGFGFLAIIELGIILAITLAPKHP